jgi:propionyl-CoA carboxylase alpha chain
MFKKILIANRGEIACRVIRTARAMGIKTVAVYSEPDADAKHVREADEAVAIGPAPSAQSYLSIERILDAVRQTGAEAVHPGYGFLSENRKFAAALEQAGVVFIGPGVEAIGAMGDKIESKKLAQQVGVSTVPGYLGVIKDETEAVAIARDVGYPVMIKASAGGGGKGMRIARSDQEVHEGFRSATNEAKSSFADDRVFIEKYIEQPRHIEIQVLGDSHGNIVYLGERECSIQRRHQKVIEEAPSPFLDAKTRAAMGAQAVALAKAVSYRSAGTVEFIVDQARNFYFLEMNTRLQVEHPVTELVTGLDLVELPSTGRLARYREPTGVGQVRIDSGVYEGAEISMFYDPMIAKVVGSGTDRRHATAALREALDSFYIRGVSHNIAFLSALLGHPRFADGRLSTNFIADEFPDGFHGAPLDEERRRQLIAVAAMIHHRTQARDQQISGRLRPPKLASGGQWVVMIDREPTPVTIAETAGGYAVINGEASHELIGDWRIGDPLYQGRINGQPISVQIDRKGVGYKLTHAGSELSMQVLSPRAAELARFMPVKVPPDMSRFLLSPMPGLLVSLAVTAGQEVKAGQELAVVEAMKMENLLRAERDGKVAKLHAAPGDSLAVDQPIVEFA